MVCSAAVGGYSVRSKKLQPVILHSLYIEIYKNLYFIPKYASVCECVHIRYVPYIKLKIISLLPCLTSREINDTTAPSCLDILCVKVVRIVLVAFFHAIVANGNIDQQEFIQLDF